MSIYLYFKNRTIASIKWQIVKNDSINDNKQKFLLLFFVLYEYNGYVKVSVWRCICLKNIIIIMSRL